MFNKLKIVLLIVMAAFMCINAESVTKELTLNSNEHVGNSIVIEVPEEFNNENSMFNINLETGDVDEENSLIHLEVDGSASSLPVRRGQFYMYPSSLSVGANNGTEGIFVEADFSWNVVSNSNWIYVEKVDENLFGIEWNSNPTTNSRSGTATVSGGGASLTFSLTQQGIAPTLSVSPSTVYCNYHFPTRSISVTSNTSWSVSDNSSWITFSPLFGSGNGGFNISCSQNTYSTTRVGTVTVSGGGITRTISVIQYGAPYYEVDVIAGTGGSVTPTSASVIEGGSCTFTVTPDEGYYISGCSNNGTISGNTLTVTNVNDDETVYVYFARYSYTVTASAGTGGSISPPSQPVYYGESCTFTVSPSVGYYASSCTGGTLSGNTVTVSNVTSNRTVYVYFTKYTYNVLATAGTGGTIKEPAMVTVEYGDDAVFEAIPDPNFEVSGVTSPGTFSGNIITVPNITSITDVEVTFSAIPVGVMITNVEAIQSFAPGTARVTYEISSLYRTVVPAYTVHLYDNGTLCDTHIAPVGTHTYDFTSLGVGDHTLTVELVADITLTSDASFHVDPTPSYTVSIVADPAGTATFSETSQTVTHGNTASFTITGKTTGYHVTGGSEGVVINDNQVTKENITADQTITVYLALNEYTVTATAGEHGSIIDPSTVTVTHGGTASFTADPDDGYYLSSVSTGTVNGNTITVPDVTDDMNITASFLPTVYYTVTATAGAGGSISPASIDVSGGGRAEFTVTCNSGYAIDESSITGGVLQDGNKIVVDPVNSNCAVYVGFVQAELFTQVSQSANSGTLYSPAELAFQYKIGVPGVLRIRRDGVEEYHKEFIAPVDATLLRTYTFEGLLSGVNNLEIQFTSSETTPHDTTITIPFTVLGTKSWKSITYAYNHLGGLETENINGDVTYHYTYDEQGRLYEAKSQIGTGSLVTDAVYTYNQNDKVSRVNYYNITKMVDYTYQANTGWVNTITCGTDFTAAHTYNNNGNINSINFTNVSVSGTASYTYDERNRLIAMGITNPVNIPSAEQNETYTYNDDGAFLTKSRTNNVYGYNYVTGTNKLQSVTYNSSTAKQFTYDAKGNVTYDGLSGVYLTEYDRRNLPLKMAVQKEGVDTLFYKYGYNDSSNRVIRESRDAMERYLYDASGRAVAVYDINTNNIKNAYLFGNDMIGKIDFTSTPERFYNVKDHLGSTRLVYDQSGTIVDRMDYLPYGEFLGSRNLSGIQEGDTRFHFTTKERDFETGYDYFGGRYLNNKLGIWNSTDPMGAMRPGISPFNYCQNNPLNRIDPTGMLDEGDKDGGFWGWLSGLFGGSTNGTDEHPGSNVAVSVLNKANAVVDKAKKQAVDTGERVVDATIQVTDAVSDGATVGAVAGVVVTAFGAATGNPVVSAAGVKITSTSLAVGTASDVTSTVAKGVDAVAFNGSATDFYTQAGATTAKLISGGIVNSTTARVVTRTGLSNIAFRGASGRFVSNSIGYGVTAVSDATKVVISMGF